jgi:hypothetical protein
VEYAILVAITGVPWWFSALVLGRALRRSRASSPPYLACEAIEVPAEGRRVPWGCSLPRSPSAAPRRLLAVLLPLPGRIHVRKETVHL